MALSASRLDVEFLFWCGEGRNGCTPQSRGFRRLRQARKVSCNLSHLQIRQILVGDKCGHRFACPLANRAQELSAAQLVAGESLGKSALSVLTVAELAIILETEIPLPNPLPLLNIRRARSLSHRLAPRKQE